MHIAVKILHTYSCYTVGKVSSTDEEGVVGAVIGKLTGFNEDFGMTPAAFVGASCYLTGAAENPVGETSRDPSPPAPRSMRAQ